MVAGLPKVAFLTTRDSPIHPVAETILKDNYEVRLVATPGWSCDDAVLRNVADASAILVRVGVVTKEVIDASPNLKVVAIHGIGVDRVDLDETSRRAIVVTNTPLANVVAVAEHTMGLILSMIKKIPASDQLIRKERWRETEFTFKQLMSMTVGIIGFGNVGTRVARRLRSFEAEILSYDPYVALEKFEEFGVEPVDLETLLKNSEIVTVHVPLTRYTKHMIGERELKMMKEEACIVNTSRGSIIDERALIVALQEKRIAGAALDVFEEEPPDRGSPLLRLDNVVMTPHVAGATGESLKRMAETAAKDIARVLSGERAVHEYRKELLPYPV